MITQNPLTLLTPVKGDCFEKLNQILERFKVGLNESLNEKFNKLGTLHYARWFILNNDSFRDKPAFPLPERLVFSSNFDGSVEEHVTGLVTIFPEYFDELYECCAGLSWPSERNTEKQKKLPDAVEDKYNGILCRCARPQFKTNTAGRSIKKLYMEFCKHK